MTAQAPLDRALGAALLDRPDGAGLTAGLDRLLERAGGVAAGCEVMALRQPVRHQRLAGHVVVLCLVCRWLARPAGGATMTGT
jgi:hypothetical protein